MRYARVPGFVFIKHGWGVDTAGLLHDAIDFSNNSNVFLGHTTNRWNYDQQYVEFYNQTRRPRTHM